MLTAGGRNVRHGTQRLNYSSLNCMSSILPTQNKCHITYFIFKILKLITAISITILYLIYIITLYFIQ